MSALSAEPDLLSLQRPGPEAPKPVMLNGTEAAFGKTASDYGKHRAGFPPAFFDRLAASGLVRPGERALDIGTGTGTVARGLARLGLDVTGMDPAEPLLAEARRLSREAHLAVGYLAGKAEATGLAAGGFDLITAGQCWHWFDRPAAAAEMARLLKPGGRLIICHFDWLPLPGNVVAATEALIRTHNPDWNMGGGAGIYPRWFADLSGAGFSGLESASFDIGQPYTHEAWRGRIRASAGISASLPPQTVEAFDREHGEMLARDFPADPLIVPHRVWWVSGVKAE
ncbi:class I SAM-dependent methyltransferase [Radicibacter daui]|uniref:class I SAM-dependent methyltransferase n=1 Tax=Radicibacter daui TaxID=3064829 RepID=UPI004046E8D2